MYHLLIGREVSARPNTKPDERSMVKPSCWLSFYPSAAGRNIVDTTPVPQFIPSSPGRCSFCTWGADSWWCPNEVSPRRVFSTLV